MFGGPKFNASTLCKYRDRAARFGVGGGGLNWTKSLFLEGEMLGNFYLIALLVVTENAFITIKLLLFFRIISDVAIGSQNSPSLN